MHLTISFCSVNQLSDPKFSNSEVLMSTTVQKYSAAQLLGSLRVGLARSFMVWIRRVLQSDLLSSFNVDSLGHRLRRGGRNQAHLPGEARGRLE